MPSENHTFQTFATDSISPKYVGEIKKGLSHQPCRTPHAEAAKGVGPEAA